MKLHIFENEQDVINAFANYFVEQACKNIQEKGQFNVVLSGGSSPKKVYELLTSPDFKKKIAWDNVYFFFGDERHVPADNIENNALMANKTLFQPLQIADDHIFKINTSLLPPKAAKAYMTTLTDFFKGTTIHFDMTMLGLGDNAHTASLFPFTSVLKETKATVKSVYLKEDNTFRISLTAPLINQSKQIAFLVFGDNKSKAVLQVIKGKQNFEMFPAQLIQPINGKMNWFLDDAAAKLLNA